MKNYVKWLYLTAIGALVFSFDFFSKSMTHQYIPTMSSQSQYPYGGIGIFKNFLGIEFSISHAINYGAAWGVFSEFQDYLLVLRVFLILALIVYLSFFNKKPSLTIPFVLIIAGATGNVVDSFLYGHVVDMIHFVFWGYDFPVFNVADSSIFIGISWLVIASVLENTPSNNCSKLS